MMQAKSIDLSNYVIHGELKDGKVIGVTLAVAGQILSANKPTILRQTMESSL